MAEGRGNPKAARPANIPRRNPGNLGKSSGSHRDLSREEISGMLDIHRHMAMGDDDEGGTDSMGHPIGGGEPFKPIPLQAPEGNRKSWNETLIYSGTTFVGTAINTTDSSTNNWFRFPWEFTQPAQKSWLSNRIVDEYLFWKAKRMRIQFKNPVCIQDVGDAASTITSGQNMHAQLFGYLDSAYSTGVAQTFNTANETLVQADVENLLSSFGNNGYSGTSIKKLPRDNISRTSFAHNFPDVQNIGMGGGASMEFKWGFESKYWRSTAQLFNLMNSTTAGGFQSNALVRWDQAYGRVAMNTERDAAGGSTNTAFLFRRKSHDIRIPGGVNQWQQSSTHSALGEITEGAYYGEPEPLPKIYLQGQPQINSLQAGVGDSVIQVQFEVQVDMEFTGKAPKTLENVVVGSNEETNNNGFKVKRYNRRWVRNNGMFMNLYSPIMKTENFRTTDPFSADEEE